MQYFLLNYPYVWELKKLNEKKTVNMEDNYIKEANSIDFIVIKTRHKQTIIETSICTV